MSRESIELEISKLRKEQVRIEKTIEKQEDEGVYDGSLYSTLDKLQEEIDEKEKLLEEL